jgi:hypothetical protein
VPIHKNILLPLLAICALFAQRSLAQLPFYTDDTNVTEKNVLHFEFYNEYDGLQSTQFPDLNQNTANFKVNYGLPHNLEFDVDVPYLSIKRTDGQQASSGIGDTNLGIKWHFLDSDDKAHRPALATSFYIEFPTGNVQQELGSGHIDYSLNTIAQEPFGKTTRLTGNFGYLFAGNTSTGVIGTTNTKGHVYTAGLSLAHDFTDRLSLGAEAYGGLASDPGLSRDQLQFLAGGSYLLHSGISASFAILGGRYEASPHIGGQLGFAVDFPKFGHKHSGDAH